MDYIWAMNELYRLSNPHTSNAEKVEHVTRQVHPTFVAHFRVCKFADLEELATETKPIQGDILAARAYRPHPPAGHAIEPRCVWNGSAVASEAFRCNASASFAAEHVPHGWELPDRTLNSYAYGLCTAHAVTFQSTIVRLAQGLTSGATQGEDHWIEPAWFPESFLSMWCTEAHRPRMRLHSSRYADAAHRGAERRLVSAGCLQYGFADLALPSLPREAPSDKTPPKYAAPTGKQLERTPSVSKLPDEAMDTTTTTPGTPALKQPALPLGRGERSITEEKLGLRVEELKQWTREEEAREREDHVAEQVA
ncbi:hypothetical protein HPB51_016189 [Rhipicephalus microplus]|uniref:Uncharacterized protein n=1 Tax=Rhipicephalus microplus TaxID=6941 RepID=A0A9J6E254_RHIMP|nr:hypothetical protein HPB51_016189 [Rhipicephalus microplus]